MEFTLVQIVRTILAMKKEEERMSLSVCGDFEYYKTTFQVNELRAGQQIQATDLDLVRVKYICELFGAGQEQFSAVCNELFIAR